MDISRTREETTLESSICERFGRNLTAVTAGIGGVDSGHVDPCSTDSDSAGKTSVADELTSNLQQVRRRFMITDILNGSAAAFETKKESPLDSHGGAGSPAVTPGGGLDMRLFFPQMAAAAAAANYAAAAEKAEIGGLGVGGSSDVGGGDSEDENEDGDGEGKENDNDSGR